MKGINYDTGFFPGTKSSRPHFNAQTARRDLEVIAHELRCGAVRISGGDLSRLAAAADAAAEIGLEVWFSPFPAEMALDDVIAFLGEAAGAAEMQRRRGVDVVFVCGCELSTFVPGFLPGEDSYARMAALLSPDPATLASMADVPARFNAFLASAAAAVRERFGGRITYAAGLWEPVDWAPFDIVSADAYRDAGNAAAYSDVLSGLAAHGKPFAATEFGCCAYEGAADRGAMGWAILDETSDPPRVRGEVRRDEREQVRYLDSVWPHLESSGAEAAFWFTFAGYRLIHAEDPSRDLDLASFGVVKMVDDVNWRRKQVFDSYAALDAR